MSIVYTHNNLIQLFQNIATAHFQLKGFGVGNTSEIEGLPNKQYPYMWVVPINSSVQLNVAGEFQTINHTFQIEVFDLVKKDRSNETEVLSDCQSILLDVIKILHNENASFEVINSPTLNPYVEKYGDDVTGWYVEVEIAVPFDSNYCDIPSDVFVTPGTSGSANPINPYLTCSTLSDCPTIITINDELTDHETRIEILEQGGSGLDCDDVAACQVIIDLQTDVNNRVQSVTGDVVDNTDPYNPIVNFPAYSKSIGLTLDGQGGVITTGSKGFSLPSFNGTILSWNIKGEDATTGSIVIDIKRNGTSIVGAGNKPTISSANSATANVSGWTSTTITAGDYIEYNVDSASTFTRINLEIKIQVNI